MPDRSFRDLRKAYEDGKSCYDLGRRDIYVTSDLGRSTT